MDPAAAGDDGDRTRDEACVEVTREHVSHAGQPFRREATACHFLLLIVSSVAARVGTPKAGKIKTIIPNGPWFYPRFARR